MTVKSDGKRASGQPLSLTPDLGGRCVACDMVGGELTILPRKVKYQPAFGAESPDRAVLPIVRKGGEQGHFASDGAEEHFGHAGGAEIGRAHV